MTQENLIDWTKHHNPTQAQIDKMNILRNATLDYLRAINDNVPDSADKTAAMRKVREAMWTANYSIVSTNAETLYKEIKENHSAFKDAVINRVPLNNLPPVDKRFLNGQ